MNRVLDLKFCNLVYSEEDKDLDIEQKLILKAYRLNKVFFRSRTPKFNIKLIHSREEFDRLWGNKTQNFISAFARKNKIVIFSYSIFDKETRWKKEEFFKTLIHEISHLFYKKLRGDEYDPLWLSEGLATFIQHEKKRSRYKKKLEIKKKSLQKTSMDITIDDYQVYTLFVEYLVLNFGKNKLLRLISELSKGRELNKLFHELYNKSFDELIEDGNKYQEIA